jgi:hypothetical protein
MENMETVGNASHRGKWLLKMFKVKIALDELLNAKEKSSDRRDSGICLRGTSACQCGGD